MVIGYTDYLDIFHTDRQCPTLSEPVIEIPESKALKWGYEYCPDCVSRSDAN